MTHEEIWTALNKARLLADNTHDRFVVSCIPLLTAALMRCLNNENAETGLTPLEESALGTIEACEEAYLTLYGNSVTKNR